MNASLRSPAIRLCLECGAPFEPKSVAHIFCSGDCEDLCNRTTPHAITRRRAVNRAWAEKHRSVRNRNPWLAGPPPYNNMLPGAGFTLDVSPLRWPIELRNARLLHGLVTELTGLPHDDQMPVFTLVPTGTGRTQWSVWISDIGAASRLAGRVWPAMFADQQVSVRCGPLMRLMTPKVTKRGHQIVRVDCLTPVRIRSNTTKAHVEHVDPNAGNLLSTIGAWLPRRIGLELPGDSLRLEVRSKQTQSTALDLGGKYGVMHGFVGALKLEVNAATRWLLEVAARGLGLGGSTAFGFGRIKVSDP